MQYKSRWVLLVCVVGLGLVTVFRISSEARTDVGPTPQQDAIRLEQRINQLDQRLYGIENQLRTLDQQSRISGSTRSSINPEDIARLRLELNALQQRLGEHECGLAKLDERTLSATVRASRRRSGANDPCRQNIDTPIQLSGTR